MFLLRESSRNDNVGSIGKFLPDVIECIDSGRFTLRAPERECHGLRIGLDVPQNLFFGRMASTAQGKMSIRRQLKRRYAPAFIQKLQACLVGMSGLLVGARATSAITRVQCLAARPFPSCVQNRWITLALLSKFMMRFATSSVAGSDQRAAVRAALPRRRLDSTLISSGPEGLLVQKLL
jgi:hypothetical protein